MAFPERLPIEHSLLFRQSTHISELAFQGSTNVFGFKMCEDYLKLFSYPSPAVAFKLHEFGLYGVLKTVRMKLDRHLLTALVERWRPETHTFFLECGETAVTLQDVSMLWGLPIRGIPACETRPAWMLDEWRNFCLDRFGWLPGPEDLDRHHFKLMSLGRHLEDQSNIPDEDDEEGVAKYARGLAALILAGTLFSTTHGNTGPLELIYMFESDEKFKAYSLGSTVLAHLYRGLCDGAIQGRRMLAGPFRLLQMWAYLRIPFVCSEGGAHNRLKHPTIKGRRDFWQDGIPELDSWRFMGELVRTAAPHNQLIVVRDNLDQIGERGFVWTPYSETSMQRVRRRCRKLWLYNGKLLSWNRCEQHPVDRVIQQFGHDHIIPLHPDVTSLAHCHPHLAMRADWLQHFHEYAIAWTEAPTRHIFRVPPPPDMIVMPDQYLNWYRVQSILILGTVSTAPRGHRGGGAATMSQGLEYLEHSHRGETLPVEEGLRVQDVMRGWLRTIGPPVVVQPYEMPVEDSPPDSPHQASPDHRGAGETSRPSTSQWASSSQPLATAPDFSPWTSSSAQPTTTAGFSPWPSTSQPPPDFTAAPRLHTRPPTYRPSPVHRPVRRQSSDDILEAEIAWAREIMERFPERFHQGGGSSRRDQSDPRR